MHSSVVADFATAKLTKTRRFKQMANNDNLNDKYFIDDNAFNCPFCGLRNTTYTILAVMKYDLNQNKEGKVIFVQCNKCEKISVHFANNSLTTSGGLVVNRGTGTVNHFDSIYREEIKFLPSNKECASFDDIDSQIFHSIPNSYFTLDKRIPKQMRALFEEAQECKKSNLKTGASACLRKLIYTLLSEQLNKFEQLKKNTGNKNKLSLEELGYKHYADCIKALKEYHPELKTFIEPLEDITGITSDQVHEDSWAELSAEDLNICLESVRDLLDQIYVQPAILQERRNKIYEMRNKAKNKTEKNIIGTRESKDGK